MALVNFHADGALDHDAWCRVGAMKNLEVKFIHHSDKFHSMLKSKKQSSNCLLMQSTILVPEVVNEINIYQLVQNLLHNSEIIKYASITNIWEK